MKERKEEKIRKKTTKLYWMNLRDLEFINLKYV